MNWTFKYFLSFFLGLELLLTVAAWECSAAEKESSIVDQLVKVVPGLPEDPLVGENVVQAVKKGLQAYPRGVLETLLQHQCYVLVAPFVVRADADLLGVHPETYPEGDTFLNCRAVYTMKGICVGAYFYRHGQLRANLAPAQGVQHETAHAIDQLLGRPSLCEPFASIYRAEKENVSLVDREPLKYYLSAGRVGPIETYAQLLANKYCHFNESHTLTLVRCFPRAVRYIDKDMDGRFRAK